MFELRKYQKDAVSSGIDFLSDKKNKKNGVVVIPTGGGKSLVIANLAKELKGNTVIFQPSKELLEQNYEKFLSYGGRASIFSASKNSRDVSDVTFATIGTVNNSPEVFKDFNNVIIDECHLVSPKKTSMYSLFFESLNVRLLGLTATPIRLKSYNYPYPHSKLCMLDRQRPKTFNKFIHVSQIKELYDLGFLSKCKYIDEPFDRSRLKINSTGADFTEASLDLQTSAQGVIEKIAKACEGNPDRKHVLIFVPSIADAAKVSKRIGCPMVSSQTDKKERAYIIAAFRAGMVRCVVNVGVLTTGFDYPEIDMVVLARPTLSLALYYQMIGRGIRKFPGKEDCLIVDLCGNHERFGEIEDLEVRKEKGWGIYSRNKILTGVEMHTQ